MKIFASCIISILLFSGITAEQVRVAFKQAPTNEEAAIAFNELMQKEMNIAAHLKLAYAGASEVMLADYGVNVPKKIKLFKSGRDQIESAIAAAPNDFEIHLIRLVIQDQIPSFLNYSSNIEEDKAFILANFSSASASLKQYFESINQDLKIFSQEELKQRK